MAVTKRTLIKNLEWLKDQDLRGRGYLRYVLWLNTVETKYHEGDIVIFSMPGHRVWNQRVEHMVGQIKKIRFFINMYDKPTGDNYGYSYEIEATFKDGRSQFTTSYYVRGDQENRLIEKKLRKSRDNFIKHPIEAAEQEMDV